MKKSKIITILLILSFVIAGMKIYSSVPEQLAALTSPDGKITATISAKSGNLLIETNRSNPLTLDFDHKLEYGTSAFSSDSRYLYVMPQITSNGYVECWDFEENNGFSISVASVIRSSAEFADYASAKAIKECQQQSVDAVNIDENAIANVVYSFTDEKGSEHSLSAWVDLYNQTLEKISY